MSLVPSTTTEVTLRALQQLTLYHFNSGITGTAAGSTGTVRPYFG